MARCGAYYNKAIPNLPLRYAMLLFAACSLPLGQPRPRTVQYFQEACIVLWQTDDNSSENAITLFILSWSNIYCTDAPAPPDQPLFRLQASWQFFQCLTAIETPETDLIFSLLFMTIPWIPQGLPLGNELILDRIQYIVRSLYKRTEWFEFEMVKREFHGLYKSSPRQDEW